MRRGSHSQGKPKRRRTRALPGRGWWDLGNLSSRDRSRACLVKAARHGRRRLRGITHGSLLSSAVQISRQRSCRLQWVPLGLLGRACSFDMDFVFGRPAKRQVEGKWSYGRSNESGLPSANLRALNRPAPAHCCLADEQAQNATSGGLEKSVTKCHSGLWLEADLLVRSGLAPSAAWQDPKPWFHRGKCQNTQSGGWESVERNPSTAESRQPRELGMGAV